MNEAFHPGLDAHNPASRPIVTSASENEDDGDGDDDSSTSSSDSAASSLSRNDQFSLSDDDANNNDGWSADDVGRQVFFPEDLLDEGADEEDEAYVYRNLRSGTLETVTVVQQHPNRRQDGDRGGNESNSASATSKKTTQLQVLKPRSSDAVLSCPCCFTIVTMDCQRHESYLNQFRAMFVMNIEVNWRETWVHSDLQQGLVRSCTPPSVAPSGPVTSTGRNQSEVGKEHYYTVNCSSCHTQVAVLDMTEEVYHFTGCLASS